MKPIRVLLGDLSSGMLEELVMEIMATRASVAIVDRYQNESELYAHLKKRSADVIILGLEEFEPPDRCSELLNTFPEVRIVGISHAGKRFTICADNLDPNELVDAIGSICGTDES